MMWQPWKCPSCLVFWRGRRRCWNCGDTVQVVGVELMPLAYHTVMCPGRYGEPDPFDGQGVA